MQQKMGANGKWTSAWPFSLYILFYILIDGEIEDVKRIIKKNRPKKKIKLKSLLTENNEFQSNQYH